MQNNGLISVMTDFSPNYAMLKYCYAEFRSNFISTNDACCLGRPEESITVENLAKIREIILWNR